MADSDVKPGDNSVGPVGSDTNPPKTWTLKVDGQDYVVKTEEELLKLAQKGESADRRYQEAARLKAENQHKIETYDALLALNSGFDENLARKALSGFNLSGPDLEAAVQAAKAQVESGQLEDPDQGQGKAGTSPAHPSQRNRPISFRDLDPELQEDLTERYLEKTNRILEEAIAADPVLKYNYKNNPKAIIAAGQKVLRRRVLETGKGIRDGNHMPEVVGELRSLQAMFGTPGGTAPGSPGLGPAPSAAGNSLYQPTEPKRVPATDRDHDDYIVKKMAYLVAKEQVRP